MCSSKADKQSFARTLVPTSLWSAVQVPIPGLAASAHRLELNSALGKRRPALEDALYHEHDWFRANPQPCDPINWAHPLTAINPWRVRHISFSTSTPPTTPRAKPQYKPPPPAHKTVYPLEKETKQRPSEKPPRKRSSQGKPQAVLKLPRGFPAPCAPPSLPPTCPIATSLPCRLARRSQGPQKRTSSTTSHAGKRQRTDFRSTAAQFSIPSDNLKQTRLPFALSSRQPPPPDLSAPAPPRSVPPDIRQFFRPATPIHPAPAPPD